MEKIDPDLVTFGVLFFILSLFSYIAGIEMLIALFFAMVIINLSKIEYHLQQIAPPVLCEHEWRYTVILDDKVARPNNFCIKCGINKEETP